MSETGPEILLNVSTLPAPEPFQRITEALATLPEGARLRVLHRREPFPLYPRLLAAGFHYRVEHEPDGSGVVILIHRPIAPGPLP